MLYLTSVLSEASLSTAEEFAAGPAQFLGSWVISPASRSPRKDPRKPADPFKDLCSFHRGNYCLQTAKWDLGFLI